MHAMITLFRLTEEGKAASIHTDSQFGIFKDRSVLRLYFISGDINMAEPP